MGEVQAERDCHSAATTQSQQFSKAGSPEGVRDAGGDRLGKLLSEQKEVALMHTVGVDPECTRPWVTPRALGHLWVGHGGAIWREGVCTRQQRQARQSGGRCRGCPKFYLGSRALGPGSPEAWKPYVFNEF